MLTYTYYVLAAIWTWLEWIHGLQKFRQTIHFSIINKCNYVTNLNISTDVNLQIIANKKKIIRNII